MRETWGAVFAASVLVAVVARPAASDDRSTTNKGKPGNCPADMVRVPAGMFHMGIPATSDASERMRHTVTLPAYCIDRTEVTVKAYAACVGARRCAAAALTVHWVYSVNDTKLFSRFCNRGDRPDHPMNCVEWSQATAYCTWVGKRLPTEAEWEYAALGNDGRRYPWGNEAPTARRLNACGTECVAMAQRELGRTWGAMYDADDGWETTAPVGSFPDGKSPFGVLDMAGNVWEWTADWSAASSLPPPPTDHYTAHVHRGGGWSYDGAGDTRAAFRIRVEAFERDADIGFRCARDVR